MTITTPDSTHINLKAATSSGSVQYNPTTTNYYIWADSRGVVSSSCYLSQAPGPDVTISAGTVSSGVLTATTSTNYYVLPTTVTLSGFTGSYTALNGQIVTLTSVPSSTQIVGPVTGVSNGSTGAGAAGCSYNPSGQLRTEPYISGHGTVINGSVSNLTTAQAIAQYTANVHPYSPAVTGYPGFLIMQLGLGDWYSSPGTWNLAITEANLQTLWATARADGWTVVETTVIPHTGSIYTSSATDISTLNIWIRAQGPTNANSTSGKYWNRLEDAALMIPDPTDANYIMQSGGEVGHLTDMGAKRWMDDVNATFADQASSPQSVPFCGVLTGIACYGGIVAQVNSGLGLSYPNFSNTGSGPDSGYQNVSWNYNYNTQAVTAEVPLATSSLFGLVKPDGTSCTVTSGVLSCSGSSSGLSGMTAGQVPIAATALHCTVSPLP